MNEKKGDYKFNSLVDILENSIYKATVTNEELDVQAKLSIQNQNKVKKLKKSILSGLMETIENISVTEFIIPQDEAENFKFIFLITISQNDYLEKYIDNLYSKNLFKYSKIKINTDIINSFDIFSDLNSKFRFLKLSKILEENISSNNFTDIDSIISKGYKNIYRNFRFRESIYINELRKYLDKLDNLELLSMIYYFLLNKKIYLKSSFDFTITDILLDEFNSYFGLIKKMINKDKDMIIEETLNIEDTTIEEELKDLLILDDLNSVTLGKLLILNFNFKDCMPNFLDSLFASNIHLLNYNKIFVDSKLILGYKLSKKDLYYAYTVSKKHVRNSFNKLNNVEDSFRDVLFIQSFISCLFKLVLAKNYISLYKMSEDIFRDTKLEIDYKEKYNDLKNKLSDKDNLINDKDKEIEYLRNKLIEKDIKISLLEKDIDELSSLKDDIKEKNKEINRMKVLLNDMSLIAPNTVELEEDTNTLYSINEMIKYLNNSNIAIIGGNVDWANKMRKKLPNIRIVTEDDGNVDLDFLKYKKTVFINLKMPHGLYYRMMNVINKNNIDYKIINKKTNINESISTMYSLLIHNKIKEFNN